MKNYELQHLPWRYVNIKNGEKTPVGKAWQQHPLLLSEIHTDNVGVILGAMSNGLCAIDFDGIQAIEHFNNTFPDIDITSIDTAMWTSGKEYRMQAAFYVPELYWTTLKRKVINSLEFRWTNTQSVLPPSKLNDGREYIWLKKPSEVGISELPESILVYWLSLILDEYNVETTEEVDIKYINDPNDIVMYAEQLKHCYPNLDYDTWIRVTWAFCDALGTTDGINVMKYYYPENHKGEYKKLLSTSYNGRRVTIGTVKKMLRDKLGMNYVRDLRKARYNETLEEMTVLRQILKEKQNVGKNK